MDSSHAHSAVEMVAQIGSPTLWLIAYVLIIRRGFLDRTFGMPVLAVCVNVAFEGMFALGFPSLNLAFRAGNFTWLIFDLIIFYTILRFGAEDFQHPFVRKWFRCLAGLGFAPALLVEWAFVTAYQDHYGIVLGCFTDLLTSALLLAMLFRRGSSRGQSLYIALCILLANALGYLLALGYPTPPPATPPVVVHTTFLCTVPLNAAYAWLLARQCRAEGINPWRRV